MGNSEYNENKVTAKLTSSTVLVRSTCMTFGKTKKKQWLKILGESKGLDCISSKLKLTDQEA